MTASRIFILFLFLLTALGTRAQEDIYAQRDSMRAALQNPDDAERLRTYQRLALTYFRFGRDDAMKDTLFSIYAEYEAEAIKQDKPDHQANAKMNRIIAYFNRKEYDKVIELAPPSMEYMKKEEIWDLYFQTNSIFVEAYLYSGNPTQALEETQKMHNLASKRNDNEAMALSLSTMSKIYKNQLRHEEMESCLRQSIELLKDSETMIDVLATEWFNLGQCLILQHRYEEALAAAQEMEKVNIRRDEKTGFVAIPQQANLWSLYIRLYLELGEYDKAEKYCDMVDEIVDSKPSKLTTTKARAEIYMSRGEYDKALEMIDKAMEYADDPISSSANGVRGLKVEILTHLGQPKEAFELFQTAANVNDSIRNLELSGQIDELRTQYEVDKHIAEKERQRIIIYAIVIICILLVIGLVVIGLFFMQKQKAYKQLVLKNQQWAEVGSFDKGLVEESGETQTADNADIAIMEGIEKLIHEKKLFNNPNVSLEMLSDEMGINRRLVSGAINRYTKKNFNTYINEFRIKEAIRIMSEAGNENLTVDAIAYDVGFNDRKVFYRAFKQITGLPPSVFRNHSLRS